MDARAAGPDLQGLALKTAVGHDTGRSREGRRHRAFLTISVAVPYSLVEVDTQGITALHQRMQSSCALHVRWHVRSSMRAWVHAAISTCATVMLALGTAS